jgi:hypothetical protein
MRTNQPYWNWLRQQELEQALATPANARSRWQQLIVKDDQRRLDRGCDEKHIAWFFNAHTNPFPKEKA